MDLTLDHVIEGVRDLDSARAQHEAAGLIVAAGGRHHGRGTANLLAPMVDSYLELMTVVDADEARSGHRGALADYLADPASPDDGGIIAYALGVSDIAAVAERMSVIGVECNGPESMRRDHGDGTYVSWTFLVPHWNQYREWWPFFVQWDEPDSDWPGSSARPGGRNPARWEYLDIGTDDVEATRTFFETGLGLTNTGPAEEPVYDVNGSLLRFSAAPDSSAAHVRAATMEHLS